MLVGKQVRVRHARNKVVPMYLDPTSRELLEAAGQLTQIYAESAGRTRGELDEAMADFLVDGPTQLIYQGLAKLLEDRCEFESVAELPPDAVREAVFRLSALAHKVAVGTRTPFARESVLSAAATELATTPEAVERALFADLKDEERILAFEELTPVQLIDRYNVALVQAILLRAVRLEARIWGETPARFRQLMRAVKFHHLIATIRPAAGENSYTLAVDGPMSLFSATQKYGKQLAFFLPTLLHCQAFELRAEVRWGAERKDKLLSVTSNDGLKSHRPDFGARTPREALTFIENFRATVGDWAIADDPNPIVVDGVTWLPDFTITHHKTGRELHLELLGYWRKVDLEAHHRRLARGLPGRFIILLSESTRVDDAAKAQFGEEVYVFKRTPVAADVAKLAARLAGIKS